MSKESSESGPRTREHLQALADEVEFWWHSIDLGQGVVTPGFKTPAIIARELQSLRLPPLAGKTVLDIETHAVAIPGYEHLELSEFYSSNQLNGDATNWWGPNLLALQGMCLAAGFSRVEVVAGRMSGTASQRLRQAGSAVASLFRRRPCYFRAVLHAWK